MEWFVVETHALFSSGRRLSGFWYSLETVKHCIASVLQASLKEELLIGGGA